MGVVSGITMSLPVRHQLAGLHEQGRQHRRAAARLRGADRVLPRGDLPRRDAVRHEPRAAAGCTSPRPCSSPFGTTLSAFWILALNSWMQTPDRPRDRATAVLIAGDWLAGDLQPVVPLPPHAHAARLGHHRVVRGRRALGVAAAARRRGDAGAREDAARRACIVAAVLVPLQIFVGDLHGLNTLEHQPAKIAAMEALWKTESGAPLVLFAHPERGGAAQRLRDRGARRRGR